MLETTALYYLCGYHPHPILQTRKPRWWGTLCDFTNVTQRVNGGGHIQIQVSLTPKPPLLTITLCYLSQYLLEPSPLMHSITSTITDTYTFNHY